MKPFISFLALFMLVSSCKNETGNSNEVVNRLAEPNAEDLITLRGNFIYHDGAAVLQTPSRVYGVVIDEKMHELNDQVKPYKSQDTDMVSVTVKGIRQKNTAEDGWEYFLKIIEIFKVEGLEETNDVIQLAN